MARGSEGNGEGGDPDVPAARGVPESLATALAVARERWPGIGVSDEAFAARLREMLPAGQGPAAVTPLPVADLLLAHGCLAGDEAALAHFDEHYLLKLPRALGRFVRDQGKLDEIIADLRVRVLVGDIDGAGGAPKIAQYRGRGPLKAWLEVTATRLAWERLKSGAEVPGGDAHAEVELAIARDPELEHLRTRFMGDFRLLVRDATREALRALSAPERNLLRWHLVENLSLRRVAEFRGLNVSSVSRDFARIRAQMLRQVKAALVAGAGLPAAEIDSVLEALLSGISVSIGELAAQGGL